MGGRQVCVMMVAGVHNAEEPGTLVLQGGRAGAGVTIRCLVTSLTKDLLPRLLKKAWGHCVFGDLQCCPKFSVSFPRSVPRNNPVSEINGQFLQPHGLVFALTSTVNRGTLYRLVCAFPNHVQSIEFITGGLQSSCRNISRMINGNRMLLSSISSKGSEYLCKSGICFYF